MSYAAALGTIAAGTGMSHCTCECPQIAKDALAVPQPRGCEQNLPDIQERCDKPTVAVACERSTDHKDLSFKPHRMCQGHATMHARDPVMDVTWLIPPPEGR